MMVRDRPSSSYLIEGVTGRACIIWYLMYRKTAALMRPLGCLYWYDNELESEGAVWTF